jgi:hypothetical protein
LKSALKSLIGKDVHWLKIDVEGFEEKVLRGWDSKILRPWIMVVEATIPNSPETDYASWDSILANADYHFVYFDGLNRFYVANEHAELVDAFSCPPNVFDGVQLSGLANSELCRGLIATHREREKKLIKSVTLVERNRDRLQARVEWLQTGLDAEKIKVDELNRTADHLYSITERIRGELQYVYASWSWRITKPLRQANLMITSPKRALRWALRLPKRMIKSLIMWAMGRTLANPGLKIHALEFLAKHPRLGQYVRQLALRMGFIVSPAGVVVIVHSSMPKKLLKNLSPHAARIYDDLKKSIDTKKN